MNYEGKLKVAIVGSGSSYLPDIAEMLIEKRESFHVDELALMDIDEYRLNCSGNFAKKMLEDADMGINVWLTTDLEKAVTDANFVITTIRVGMSEGRLADEGIPPKYNFIGQETTAPGGFMMGIRNIPDMLHIAKAIETYSVEGAWLINLANPSGMMTEALKKYSTINSVGLCNGPTVFSNLMRGYFKDEIEKEDDIFIMMSGLNHILYGKVFIKGVDRTKDARYRLAHGWKEAQPFRIESMKSEILDFIQGWIPFGPYARYYYQFQQVLEGQEKSATDGITTYLQFIDLINEQLGETIMSKDDLKSAHTRADWVKYIETVTLDLLGKLDPRGYKLASMTRGGRDYGRAGIDMIEALWTGKRAILHPDYISMGTVPGFDEKYVVTTTSVVDRAGVHPVACDPLPPHVMAVIQAAKQYELKAVDASMSGSYRDCMEALMSSSLINDWDQARACLDEMLLAQKDYLPRFAKVIEMIENGQDPLIEELKDCKY